MATRIVTWNLQGRERPDLDAVHEVLAGLRPDVVALQEVQPGQARGLARRLGWHATWRFKHWPVVVPPPEGLALLTPAPLGDVATLATYRDAGLRDAWTEVRPTEPGPTNWPGSRDRAPTQRLDYVLVGGPLDVVDAVVPGVDGTGFERFGAISDHLPVAATVASRPPEP